ncbi:origin recognition complex subunit 2-domain-containing protein [Cunninghamella echinulata]|nr:origin recognition complex subunit 2-domain-containing protein [Cunninghamella echinulata]
MEIKYQSNQDIPVHIIYNVNSEQKQKEVALANRLKNIQPQRIRKNAATDLGLTVNSSTSDKQSLLEDLKKRYEKQQLELQDENDSLVIQRFSATDEALELTKTNRIFDNQDNIKNGCSSSDIQFNNESHNSRNKGVNNMDDIQNEKENLDTASSSGRHIFGFTNTRHKSSIYMMKKAMNGVEQPLEDSNNNNGLKVKKRGRPCKNKIKINDEEALEENKRLRLERKKEILDDAKKLQQQKESVYEEEEEEEEEEEYYVDQDIDEVEEDDGDGLSKKQSLLDENSGYERYFQDLHGTSKTSNNTLSKLSLLEPHEFQSILNSAPVKHEKEINTLVSHHEQHFPQWYFELQSGFNLLFYGYGSKRNLINKFTMAILNDGPVIVVNGFFPSVTIKDIMLKILVGALDTDRVPGTLHEQLALVRGYFGDKKRIYKRLYLVVHNIDGANLRNEQAQAALATLAESNNIHLIGSIDQINAGLLWDNMKTTRFNWIYHDATTFGNYLVETSFENSLLMRSGELGGARGVQYVLTSLTSNARGIFRVLAEYQLIEMEISNQDRGNENVGLPYHQYYEKCREAFLVSTEIGMRSQLTEFRDHKVIATKRLPDGTEIYFMPLEKGTLTNIIENMD